MAQVVEHAGFRRAILNPNPPLIDEDGYDIDSDDNEEHVQEAMAAAADANPYSSIQLERTTPFSPRPRPWPLQTYIYRHIANKIDRAPGTADFVGPTTKPSHTVAPLYLEDINGARRSGVQSDAQGERCPMEGPTATNTATRRPYLGALRHDVGSERL